MLARVHPRVPAIVQAVSSCFVEAQGLVSPDKAAVGAPLCSLCLNKQPLPLLMVLGAQLLRIVGWGAYLGGCITVLCPPALKIHFYIFE